MSLIPAPVRDGDNTPECDPERRRGGLPRGVVELAPDVVEVLASDDLIPCRAANTN